ncbi:hypothetical protein Fmac_007311 [Flemingia macrophylla]|uniref:Uncharacterized protein n=1 Tax=Flemingia macrophylla TaxID=520843 RepID=A0ABD1MU70_9FABA
MNKSTRVVVSAGGVGMGAGQGSEQVEVAGKVIAEPGGGSLSHDGLLVVVLVVEEGVLKVGLGGGGEAPDLGEVGAGREGPEGGGSGRGDEGDGGGVVFGDGVNALAEDEGGGGREKGLVVGDGGEGGGGGAGAGGGDDGGLSLAEEPLDGLAVGLVAELPRELEDAGGADDGHANAAAAAVHLAVAVLGWRLLDGEGGGGAVGVGGVVVGIGGVGVGHYGVAQGEERRGEES